MTDLLCETLTRPTTRNKTLTSEMKLMVTLRYLAAGIMQLCSGEDLDISQKTVNKVISGTNYALSSNDILVQFIEFSIMPQEIYRKKVELIQIDWFPDVISATDDTRIRITTPSEFKAEYMNMKIYYSISAQVVFDAKYNMTDIVSR